jgi:hypothetical protein
MDDIYKPGEAYALWIDGRLDHDAFWEVIQRRSAAAQGKSWEQYCDEMRPLTPIDWSEWQQNLSEIDAILPLDL